MGSADAVSMSVAQAFGLKHLGRGQRRLLTTRRRYVMFAGALGAGKSLIGAVKAHQLSLANPGCKAWITAQTVMVHEQNMMGEALSLLDAFRDLHGWGLDVSRTGGKEPKIQILNGSMQYYVGEKYANRNRGPSLGFGIMDEATKLHDDIGTFEALNGRIRGDWPQPQLIVLTNLDYGESGLVAHFVQQCEAGNPDYDMIFAPTWENPYNGPRYAEQQIPGKSRAWVAAMVVGALTKPQASVYPEWSNAVHIVPWDPVRDGIRRWLRDGGDMPLPWGIGVDWGMKPWVGAYQMVALDAECRAYHPDAAPPDSKRALVWVDEDAKDYGGDHRFKAALGKFIKRNSERFRSPPTWVASDREDPGMNRELWKMVPHRTSRWIARTREEQEVWPGVERVRELLDPIDGPPGIYVTEELHRRPESQERGIVTGFKVYRRKFSVISRSYLAEPIQDDLAEHCMDPVRYTCVQHFGQVRGDTFAFSEVIDPSKFAGRRLV